MSYINEQFENIRNFNIYKEKTMCKELVYFISGTKNITAYDSNPISKEPNSMEYFSSYNSNNFTSKSKYQKKLDLLIFSIRCEDNKIHHDLHHLPYTLKFALLKGFLLC